MSSLIVGNGFYAVSAPRPDRATGREDKPMATGGKLTRLSRSADNKWPNRRKATMSVDLWLWVILIVMVSVVITQNIGLKDRLRRLESVLHR